LKLLFLLLPLLLKLSFLLTAWGTGMEEGKLDSKLSRSSKWVITSFISLLFTIEIGSTSVSKLREVGHVGLLCTLLPFVSVVVVVDVVALFVLSILSLFFVNIAFVLVLFFVFDFLSVTCGSPARLFGVKCRFVHFI